MFPTKRFEVHARGFLVGPPSCPVVVAHLNIYLSDLSSFRDENTETPELGPDKIPVFKTPTAVVSNDVEKNLLGLPVRETSKIGSHVRIFWVLRFNCLNPFANYSLFF